MSSMKSLRVQILTSGFIQKITSLCKLVFLLGLFVGLLGCDTELYSGLKEKEANDMLAVLMRAGIKATKQPGKKDTIILMVNQNEIADAIDVLKEEGYPKHDHVSLGDVFQKNGLISSPLEERARYIYAVSQEISDTLSHLDGVLNAKVHIVLPELDATGEVLSPSSASVFIKHQAEYNLQPFVPQFKQLVNNSIEGLDYEKISVALFPSVKLEQGKQLHFDKALGIRVHPTAKSRVYILFGMVLVLLLISFALNGWFIWKSRKSSKAPD